MDVLFEETDWLCFALLFSSGNCRWWTCSSRRQTDFAPLGPPMLPWENRMKGDRQTHKHKHIWTDIATTRKNRPSGPILWKEPGQSAVCAPPSCVVGSVAPSLHWGELGSRLTIWTWSVLLLTRIAVNVQANWHWYLCLLCNLNHHWKIFNTII